MDTIAIHIPATPELTKLVEELLKHPDVRRLDVAKDPGEFLTVKEAAEEAKMSYSAFRRLVVDRKLLRYSRPSGPKGHMLIRRSELINFLQNPQKNTRGGRKSGGIKII